MEENADTDNKSLEGPRNQESSGQSDAKKSNVESDNTTSEEDTEKIPARGHPLHDSFWKSTRHYFFEFIMMFLAVFAGFLADNWREQMQEHKREKEFIHSIVEDLKSDTIQSGRILVELKKTSTSIDSVLAELSSPDVIENSNNVYRLWTKNLDIKTFVSNDRTIQQLKNSGELRLIRSKVVSDGIMQYDQAVKNYYQQSNFMYNALSDQHIYSQFFDFISLNKNKDTPVPLTDQGKKMLNEAYAHLQLWNSGLVGLISWLENVDNEGKDLLVLIQEEYHIN